MHVRFQRSNDENGNCSGGSMEFPTTNLYELESRVFTDHWSIPYKREESLGKCLIASTCLARHGKTMFVGNENLCFCIKLNALLLRNCVGGMFLFAPLGVFHMLLFWTLMLHGSICMSVVTANFFSSMLGRGINMWIQHLPLCQVLLTLMRTASGS